MNLDELQSVQARERQSSDLQHLRSSFYREVGEYIQDLTEERDELVAQAEDPFSVPAVRQLTDDIETAEQTIEAIYERRVGKVVKKASIAAAGMPVGDDGLTAEESELFEDLVSRIEENRDTVLSVLDGASSAGTYSFPDDDGWSGSTSNDEEDGDGDAAAPSGVEDDAEATTDGVSAADVMGTESADGADEHAETSTAVDDSSTDDTSQTEVPPEPVPPGGTPDESGESPEQSDELPEQSDELPEQSDDAGTSPSDGPEASPGSEESGTSEESRTSETDDHSVEEGEVTGLPRTTVRITDDVGEVVGADNRDYDLRREDVVTLPEPNAEVLVDNDAAERLD